MFREARSGSRTPNPRQSCAHYLLINPRLRLRRAPSDQRRRGRKTQVSSLRVLSITATFRRLSQDSGFKGFVLLWFCGSSFCCRSELRLWSRGEQDSDLVSQKQTRTPSQRGGWCETVHGPASSLFVAVECERRGGGLMHGHGKLWGQRSKSAEALSSACITGDAHRERRCRCCSPFALRPPLRRPRLTLERASGLVARSAAEFGASLLKPASEQDRILICRYHLRHAHAGRPRPLQASVVCPS